MAVPDLTGALVIVTGANSGLGFGLRDVGGDLSGRQASFTFGLGSSSLTTGVGLGCSERGGR